MEDPEHIPERIIILGPYSQVFFWQMQGSWPGGWGGEGGGGGDIFEYWNEIHHYMCMVFSGGVGYPREKDFVKRYSNIPGLDTNFVSYFPELVK